METAKRQIVAFGGGGFSMESGNPLLDDYVRQASFIRFLREGMCGGYAAEDGAALHFVGQELSHVVSSRPKAFGYRLDVTGRRMVEMRIATAYLDDRDAAPTAPLPETLSTAPAAG
jgi:dipeptidase E